MCGKLFKNISSLEDHLEILKKNDIYHKLFFDNKISFEDKFVENIHKNSDQTKLREQPEFGKINIKKEKKID